MSSSSLIALAAVVLLPLALGMATLLVYWLARRAAARSQPASDASSTSKRVNDLQIQVADLASSFDSLLESHKRLRSRAGMRELRERRGAEAPPPGSPKAALMRHYGFGQVGPAFAQHQLDLERAHRPDQSAE